MRYRRANTAGGTYFSTVNLAERHSGLLVRHIEDLRTVLQKVKQAHPFATLAMVVMPEHLHAPWRLPSGDADYPLRWSQIKAGFSRRLAKGGRIRDNHYNPVKHGLVSRPVDWPHSTLHGYRQSGTDHV